MSSSTLSGSRANEVARVPVVMGTNIEGGNLFETNPVPLPICAVCLKSWTCNGAHRICCIPCGHMYGRSCLEWWLQSSDNESATCPVCSQLFERRHIINLCAPANLWNGCCRIQEKLRAKLEKQAACKAELEAKIMELTSLLAEKEKFWNEQLARMERKSNEQLQAAKAKMIRMKERIKKMAEEKKAESEELMERIFPPLSPAHTPLALALAPTCVVKKKRSRCQLPPARKPSSAPDVVVEGRWQQAGTQLQGPTNVAESRHLTITQGLAQDAARRGDGAGPSHYPARLLYPSPFCSRLMKQGPNASHKHRQL